MTIIYKVEEPNLTINYILKNKLKISSRLFTKLINNNLVNLNHTQCDTRSLAHVNDIITIDLNYTEDNSNIVSTQMTLDIIYEDNSIIVLNKPSGIAIHPSREHYSDTLSNGLKYYFDKIGIKKKIRPVNRLDYYTAGLVIFAKNEYIQEYLIKQMNSNLFHKEYLAIITGKLNSSQGIINKPITRKPESIIERTISPDGKPSITHYSVLKEFSNYSLIKCKLETGRTHQIRVHFSSIGHPLLGDTLYGKSSELIKGQALLCYKLSFIHPISGKEMCFKLNENYFENIYQFL